MECTRRGPYYTRDVENSLVSFNGRWFFSSHVLIAELKVKTIEETLVTTVAGPAHTSIHVVDGMNVDQIITLTCECEHILQRWTSRPRRYDWPPDLLRQRITYEHLLVGSLNDTQIKLYTLLKITNKDILKPRGFSLSFFILKNNVLGLAKLITKLCSNRRRCSLGFSDPYAC